MGNLSFDFNQAYLSIAIVSISFLFYHFISESGKISNYFHSKYKDYQSLYHVLFTRITGVLFYGIIPVITVLFLKIPFTETGLNSQNLTFTLTWAAGLSFLMIIINLLSGKNETNLKMYPQIRLEVWSKGTLVVSMLSWIAYLFAYEFMFRGYLLFLTYHELGAAGAIIINTSLYALVHVPKGIREAIGAVPLGIVLCILCLISGNIWIALVTHVSLALSNEWISLKEHPDIKLI
ncbi:MAG: CPBP family intramembrane glutamic endopeptidase [Bacteroidota bacterium]